MEEDFEAIRGVLRLAAKYQIDTPGFAMAALRRIEDEMTLLREDLERREADFERYYRAAGGTL